MSKPSMALSKCLNYVAGTFAVVTMLAVFVPFSPELPVIGNEGSCRFALNQDVAQGLVFGTDIVYTYGPYASIFTKYYHPATDRLMLGGSGFLALCYAVLLIVLAATVHRPWMLLVYTTLCAGIMYSHEIVRTGPRDALLY